VAGSEIPVISAVGHETDFTIVDFVADLRAGTTPSAAAELVIRSRVEVETQAEAARERLVRAMERRLLEARHALMERAQDGAFARMMDFDPAAAAEGGRSDLPAGARRAATVGTNAAALETVAAVVRHYDLRRVLAGIRGELEAGRRRWRPRCEISFCQNKVRLERMGRALEVLSPLAILERGYALVFDGGGSW